ncbi:MalY/PatB family protein [Virgibacillus siamensis]|uniref:MalY/PatB family protein n=1 Tax=Virgibacillus siamensis TaxID=480071 RepID=UPI0009841316|nr:MalY/PatB family protein [Virgibacillus siamensis]
MGIFEEIHDRKNTRSVKWDMLKPVFQTDDVLPMWVADMDFKAPQAVNDALKARADHGIYGYTIIDEDIKKSITNWVENRHNWTIKQDWLSFSPGVVASLHMAVQTFTKPHDKVLIQTPVYTPFYKVIEGHDRQIVKNKLQLKDNYYHIDFADFEEKLKEVQAFMLCSPHNPVGRVWTEEELQKMAELCLKHDVIILSDEIHADLIYPGQKHVPIASLSADIANQTITFMSPSKTFNLAGLQASYIITANEDKRNALSEQLEKQGHHMLNTMGNTALYAAYEHGEEWLDELRNVLKENQDYATELLEEKTGGKLQVIRSEGTYLLWIDCSKLNMDKTALKKFMIETAKVGLNAGADYGEEGDPFMRMNLACPKQIVEEGVDRIVKAVNTL